MIVDSKLYLNEELSVKLTTLQSNTASNDTYICELSRLPWWNYTRKRCVQFVSLIC